MVQKTPWHTITGQVTSVANPGYATYIMGQPFAPYVPRRAFHLPTQFQVDTCEPLQGSYSSTFIFSHTRHKYFWKHPPPHPPALAHSTHNTACGGSAQQQACAWPRPQAAPCTAPPLNSSPPLSVLPTVESTYAADKGTVQQPTPICTSQRRVHICSRDVGWLDGLKNMQVSSSACTSTT